eukprot:COSAG01_NODE_28052_length_670_cov_1.488616_1_plen_131_part_00
MVRSPVLCQGLILGPVLGSTILRLYGPNAPFEFGAAITVRRRRRRRRQQRRVIRTYHLASGWQCPQRLAACCRLRARSDLLRATHVGDIARAMPPQASALLAVWLWWPPEPSAPRIVSIASLHTEVSQNG